MLPEIRKAQKGHLIELQCHLIELCFLCCKITISTPLEDPRNARPHTSYTCPHHIAMDMQLHIHCVYVLHIHCVYV